MGAKRRRPAAYQTIAKKRLHKFLLVLLWFLLWRRSRTKRFLRISANCAPISRRLIAHCSTSNSEDYRFTLLEFECGSTHYSQCNFVRRWHFIWRTAVVGGCLMADIPIKFVRVIPPRAP